jgi:hypothetical protein
VQVGVADLERAARQKLRRRRAEQALDTRMVSQALKDHERAVRGLMAAGLSRDEAVAMADRPDDAEDLA